VPLAAAAAEAAVDEAGLIVGAAAVAPVGVEAGGGAPSPCSCFSSWSSVRAFAERRVDAAGPAGVGLLWAPLLIAFARSSKLILMP